jgi:hypothetical protein
MATTTSKPSKVEQVISILHQLHLTSDGSLKAITSRTDAPRKEWSTCNINYLTSGVSQQLLNPGANNKAEIAAFNNLILKKAKHRSNKFRHLLNKLHWWK